MSAYADAVRHLLAADPGSAAERHGLARAVLAAANDSGARYEAFRLTQEAFDRSPAAFRLRAYRLWQALSPDDKPEIAAPVGGSHIHPMPPETSQDDTGLARHRPRRLVGR